MAAESAPRYVGGQAVLDGVMMRGEHVYAVAVRTPEGAIEVEVQDAPNWAQRWGKVPLVRGVVALAESMVLGMRALVTPPPNWLATTVPSGSWTRKTQGEKTVEVTVTATCSPLKPVKL